MLRLVVFLVVLGTAFSYFTMKECEPGAMDVNELCFSPIVFAGNIVESSTEVKTENGRKITTITTRVKVAHHYKPKDSTEQYYTVKQEIVNDICPEPVHLPCETNYLVTAMKANSDGSVEAIGCKPWSDCIDKEFQSNIRKKGNMDEACGSSHGFGFF